MRLSRYSFLESAGQASEWSHCDLTLHRELTLLAGKNATGKSRVIYTVIRLAELLSGRLAPRLTPTQMRAHFDRDDGDPLTVEVEVAAGKVMRELVKVAGRDWLYRDEEGKGWLDRGGERQSFHLPPEQLAMIARRDLSLHPELESINQWATGVRSFPFADGMGQRMLGVFVAGAGPLLHTADKTVGIFKIGKDKYGGKFVDAIRCDMQVIGYELESVDAVESGRTVDIPHEGETLQNQPLIELRIREKGVGPEIGQLQLSSGMWRTLALIIHLNYLALARPGSGLICVDDIGEGLDFARAASLIELVKDRAPRLGVQALLSTNHHLVMNAVPLDHWAIIQRQGSKCRFATASTHPEQFADFRFTGLSNFNFFEMEFATLQSSDVSDTPLL